MNTPDSYPRTEMAPDTQDPLTYAVAQRDRNILQIVQQSVLQRQSMLAYHPVMRAQNPSQVAFYEGLIRVLDETGRIIPARDFISQIETSELGREIDVAALRLGMDALRSTPALRLSINMSARSIGYRGWTDLLHHYLSQDETIGDRLILEISEKSAMLLPDILARFMAELQTHGICFALDNYGAGETAIRHFKDFDFDILKIDGQFIRDISQTPDNRVIAAALISVAQHFDMLTVAENVETGEDARLLIDMGIDCLQGHYFGAPTLRPAWMGTDNKQTG